MYYEKRNGRRSSNTAGWGALIYPRGDIRMLSYVSRQTPCKQKASAYSLQARGALNFCK